jgi:hypothetical protein
MIGAQYTFSAVAYQEHGLWVAQCLEFDICAQAKTLPQLHRELVRVLVATAAVGIELGRKPFEGIEKAPAEFWRMFDQAKISIEGQEIPHRIPTLTPLPPIVPRIRIVDRLAA